jgi:hypothetical protein
MVVSTGWEEIGTKDSGRMKCSKELAVIFNKLIKRISITLLLKISSSLSKESIVDFLSRFFTIFCRGTFAHGELVGTGFCKHYSDQLEYFGEFSKDKTLNTWGHIEYDCGVFYDGETKGQMKNGMVGSCYYL